MNDPNAPIFFNGNYHMFYQYNPNAAVWGDMHWGHAISSDMVHWKHLPVALAPTPGGPDANGCFSGTAAVQDDHVVILYTAVHSAPEDQATIKDGPRSMRETQCLATTNDPDLKTWSKLTSPIIQSPPPGLQVNGFRDPSPWRQGDWWYMVVGSGIANEGGAVLLYKSKDLRSWEFVHIFAGRKQSGAKSLDPIDPWEVWECPEFFPLGDKHVLIYSTMGKVCWQSGDLDQATMKFHPERSGLVDYGSFYAAKTQLDKSGNRIIWGWIPEARPVEEQKAAGWAGMMSLPRVLSLGDDGQLKASVAAEVNALRSREQKLSITADDDRDQRQIEAIRIEGCCGEIKCSARRTQEPFELALQSTDGAATWLRLKYDPQHPGQISVDSRPLPLLLKEPERLELHLYVDGSVIEFLVNQQQALTRRFYPAGNTPQDLRLQWTGTTASIASLSVWQITPASTDRLTT
jgi:beta-fructofuranosidase